MEVVAIQDGFHAGSRRRKGARFDVPDGETASWFAPVDQGERLLAQVDAPKPATTKPKVASKAEAAEKALAG